MFIGLEVYTHVADGGKKEMEKLTFLKLAKRVLSEENRPLSPSEIWKVATAKGYDSQLQSQGKTPGQTLYSAVFLDQRDNPLSEFVKVGTRPARYFLKELATKQRANELERVASSDPKVPEKYHYKESSLHPFLSYFVDQQFNAYAKTIRHNTSSRKEFGEWVHPDVIAIHYPLRDWCLDVVELSAAMGAMAVKFYSFEIKKRLSFGNLREAFFQAVSNSSWSNEGYLAAADISTDDDFQSELRRLSASFGIGVVQLDVEDPNASQVLFPARERDTLDWDTLDKLGMNQDVRGLLKRVKNDLKTTEIRKEDWDRILSPDELIATIAPTCR
ncbi:HTH domain-containing protein [Methyloligella sp. 2.7D]|uniref:HTH domain-containing protein n=1 Tax=unclassified Methyloligella TaxID=2625955 RepID=UPI00157DF196|nr:HTH domain-containing protein [Methyloligella sp. GL2]QKP78447.1 hypothetical protein HT051_13945 [Methyloligella sp. GL2]